MTLAHWIWIGIGLYAAFSWAQALGYRDRVAFELIFRTKSFRYSALAFSFLAFLGYGIGFWTPPFFVRFRSLVEGLVSVMPSDYARQETLDALRVVRQNSGVFFAFGLLSFVWSGAGLFSTMDQAFANLVSIGLAPEEASRRTATLAADYLGLADRGRLTPGAWADIVVLVLTVFVDVSFGGEKSRAAAGGSPEKFIPFTL